MKKRYRLNENGKFAIMLVALLIIAIVGTQLYIKRIEEINQGTFIVINDNEMDK